MHFLALFAIIALAAAAPRQNPELSVVDSSRLVYSPTGYPPYPGLWSRVSLVNRGSRSQPATPTANQAVVLADDDSSEEFEDEGEYDDDFKLPPWHELFPSLPPQSQQQQQGGVRYSDPPVPEQRLPGSSPITVGKFDPKGKYRQLPTGQIGRYKVVRKDPEQEDEVDDESDESQEDELQEDPLGGQPLNWEEWFPTIPQAAAGGQQGGGQRGGQPGGSGGRYRTGMGGVRLSSRRRISVKKYPVPSRRYVSYPSMRNYYPRYPMTSRVYRGQGRPYVVQTPYYTQYRPSSSYMRRRVVY